MYSNSPTTVSRLVALLFGGAGLILLATGCGGDAYLSSNADDLETTDLSPVFDGATLVVESPLPAQIALLDEPLLLSAQILSSTGEPLDSASIVWTSDQVEETILLEGASGDVELEPAIHAITATADLPNGDRLQTTLGGIRVQSRHTGVYSGQITIALSGDFQGTPIQTTCSGGLDFVIDMLGQAMGGQGQCLVDLIVMGSFDVTYDVGADIEGDDAEGEVQVDMGFFPVGMPWTGNFVSDGELEGNFEGSMVLFAMDGTIEAHRVSLYVDP